MAQLAAIREFKVMDFSEAQKAFAVRLIEDRHAIADLKAELGNLVGEAPNQPDQNAQSVNNGVKTALGDLMRHCDVASEALPPCPSTTEASQVNALASLWHFYAQVGFGSVPPITFDALQLSPSFAHKLVGDKAWNGFWTTTEAAVTGGQYIPTSFHNYLKHVVETKKQELAAMVSAGETARVRLLAARTLASERKLAGDPL
jgi:hypothetical protein